MKSYSFRTASDPACASRVCRLKVAPATRMCSFRPSRHTGWPSLTLSIDENETSLASTIVTPPLPSTSTRLVGADERRRVLVEADADRERVVRQRREQAAEPVALAEVLVDDEAVGEAEARARGARCPRSPTSLRRRTRSCARSGCWRPRWCRRRSRRWRCAGGSSFATGVPPSSVEMRSWLPPVKKMPVASLEALQAARLVAVAARVEVHRRDASRADVAEQLLVARPGLGAAGWRSG